MLKKILLLLFVVPIISFAEVRYDISDAQIKPFISKSFGTGYMGLSQEPEEPGYGIFYRIKILSDEVDIDKVTENVIQELSCKNNAVKPLLDEYYTVSFNIYDSNNDFIVSVLANKNSCNN